MARPRTMSIGGATFDLFVRMDRSAVTEADGGLSLCFPAGAKIKVEQIIETCGGGAANTSVGLARLECDTSFCGVVGSDQWGERLLKNLQDEHVDILSATVVEGENSSSSIILSLGSGERVILYNAGTNIHLQDATFDREAASKCDWLYLTHLQQGSTIIFDDIITILSHPTKTVGLTWNPGSTQIKEGWGSPENRALLARTRVLLVNKEEAAAFTKTKETEEALRILSDAGAAVVCVTDGKNGAMATDGKTLYRCAPIADAAVVDVTGAGDAFGTGVTWAILNGLDLPTALRAGTISSTSVLGFFGAQAGLLTNTEMQKRLSSSRPDVQMTPLR